MTALPLPMLSLNFNAFPVLHTDRLILRQPTPQDAPEMLFLRSDPACMQFLDRDPCKTLEEAEAFINIGNEGAKKGNSISWGITLKDSDTLIGSLAFWRIQKEHFRAEIGYVLHPSFQGKGIMTEAIATALNYAFQVMGIHSVEANTNPDNIASRRLLEKLGFIQEALFRQNYYYNGRFLDSAIYSLISPLK